MGDTFPTLTDLDYLTQTYHFETIPFLQSKGAHLY